MNGVVMVLVLVVFYYEGVAFFFDMNAVVVVNAVAGVGVAKFGFGGFYRDVLYLFAGIQ